MERSSRLQVPPLQTRMPATGAVPWCIGMLVLMVSSGTCLQEDLTQYAPDGKEQQAAVTAIADQDAFNWGYDPVHYSTPEGSYASNPDGPTRSVNNLCLPPF